jgi:hypothetical protein
MSLLRAFAIAAALGLAATGCNASQPTQSQEAPAECAPGDACTCNDTCARLCNGSGCYFQCNSGDCTFSCPTGNCQAYVEGGSATELGCADGGCALEANGAGTFSVDCPGGGCGVFCTGATRCAITRCTHDCTIRCDGVPDGGCQSSCGDAGNCLTFIE